MIEPCAIWHWHSKLLRRLDLSQTAAKMAATPPPTSQVPEGMEGFTVGIIGMGDMGKMYARRLSAAGWR